MSAAAWFALAIDPGGAASPSHGLHESMASVSLGWALMLAAMMGPLVAAPLRHVCARSFARRRARAVALFGCGYVAIWMAAGIAFGIWKTKWFREPLSFEMPPE